MSQFDLSAALEECIEGLQSGIAPEKLLERFPDHADELKPLLQTAAWMRTANQEISIPRAAQARSRMEFLTRASQPAPKRGLFWVYSLRVAVTIVIFAVLMIGLLSTGLASVSALPGDTFYPVKIAIEQAQINFSSDPSQRITLMESYDQRRAQEVNQLKTLGRRTQVSFAGSLLKEDDQWSVAGVLLDLTPSQSAQAPYWEGVTVEVTGLSDGNTVQVQEIQPRLIEFSARLQQMSDGVWVAGGIQVNLTKTTQVNGSPALGSSLDIVAGRLEDGQLVAITITVQGQNQPEERALPTMIFPSLTPENKDEEGPAPRNATIQPAEPTEPTGPSATATPNEPGETEITFQNPESGSTPTPAPTQIEQDHPESTAAPTQTVQPSVTPQPSRTGDGDPESTRTYEYSRATRTPTPQADLVTANP